MPPPIPPSPVASFFPRKRTAKSTIHCGSEQLAGQTPEANIYVPFLVVPDFSMSAVQTPSSKHTATAYPAD